MVVVGGGNNFHGFQRNAIVNSVKGDIDKQRGQLSRTNKEGNCHGQTKRATVTDK